MSAVERVGHLIVRRVSDDSEVQRIPLSALSARRVETIVAGLLRNMSDEFYVDDSAFDHLYRKER